jgi:coenzyme F420-reducing hydrogenase alpha subunit
VIKSIPPWLKKNLSYTHQINDGKPVHHTLYYHYARLIETVFAAERTRELLEDPD